MIRRNKDKQNLSNHNIKYNFSNEMLSSLKDILRHQLKRYQQQKKIIIPKVITFTGVRVVSY